MTELYLQMGKGKEKRTDVASPGYLRPGLPHTSAISMRCVAFRYDSHDVTGNMACLNIRILVVLRIRSGLK